MNQIEFDKMIMRYFDDLAESDVYMDCEITSIFWSIDRIVFGDKATDVLKGIDKETRPELTPEQEAILKKHLIRCRKAMTVGACLRSIKRHREMDKIHKSRFWWWLDEL
jgi:hypothetical protein